MAKNGTLDGFIDELIVISRVVPGINFVPPDPVEAIGATPAAVIYESTFVVNFGKPFGTALYQHNIVIAMLAPKGYLATTNQIMLPLMEPYIEEIAAKLYGIGKYAGAGFVNIENIEGGISGVYSGNIEWAGVDYLGWLLTLANVKIQRIVTGD